MNYMRISIVAFAAAFGALAGAGGLQLAQSRGLLQSRIGGTLAHDHDDNDVQDLHGSAERRNEDIDDHDDHAHQDVDGDSDDHQMAGHDHGDDDHGPADVHDHGDDIHDEHAEDPDSHAGHDDHGDESFVQLSAEEMARFGVELAEAGPGKLVTRISLPGEVALNADRVAHIVPRAPGIVREVFKSVGDTVRAGEVMAWLESAELGAAKVDYLAKWAEFGCCVLDLSRAREVHRNTLEFLETLDSSPSLEMLRDMSSGATGENRSDLVSAYAALVYAEAAYKREKQLLAKELASERDFQAAEAEYRKADALYSATRDSIAFKVQRDLLEAERTQQVRKIELQGAEQRLSVLGLSAAETADLRARVQLSPAPAPAHHQCTDPNCKNCPPAANEAGTGVDSVSPADEQKLAWYPLRAPFDGRVIEKHLTLGEKHGDDSDAFTVADLSSVWVNIAVYQKDLAYVKEGLSVAIFAGAGLPGTEGVIAYVSPVVDEMTRTALARVVLPNPSGDWRPGLFVNAELAFGEDSAAVVVPKSAIQRMDEEQVVFLDTSEGLKPVPVRLGRANTSHVEVLAGLSPGQRFVTRGAFELKAKIVTSGLDAHAGHGH